MKAWKGHSLGEVCNITAGGTPSRSRPEFFNGDVPWVKIGDMLQGEITQTEEGITKLGLENSAAKVLPVGTVLISIFATIGRTAVLNIAASTNQAIAGLTPRDPTILSPLYLRHYLDSVVADLQRRARGVAQVNINSGILKALQIPLPPLTEQEKIASVLGQADVLRAKRGRAAALLDEMGRAIFADMFGRPESAWSDLTVEDVADPSKALSGQARLVANFCIASSSTPESPFWVSIMPSTMSSDGPVGGISPRRSTRDFLAIRYAQEMCSSRSWALVGDAQLSPKIFLLHINTKHLCCITLDRSKCLPEFLHSYFLWHPNARAYLERMAKGAIMSGLNMSIIKSLPISLPPMELQREYVTRMESIRELKSGYIAHLDQINALFESLQSRAFRGEL